VFPLVLLPRRLNCGLAMFPDAPATWFVLPLPLIALNASEAKMPDATPLPLRTEMFVAAVLLLVLLPNRLACGLKILPDSRAICVVLPLP
jgi:hypothetical protein